MRSLEDEKTFDLVITKKEIRKFYDISGCTDENLYYVPMRKNQASVDSIMVNMGYFHITVTKDHSISRIQMEIIVEELKMKNSYFVVPDWMFEEFKRQSSKKKKPNQETKSGQGIVKEQMT